MWLTDKQATQRGCHAQLACLSATIQQGVQQLGQALRVQVVHVRHAVHRGPCVAFLMHMRGVEAEGSGVGAYQTDTCVGWSMCVKLSVMPAPTKMLVNARTPMSIMFLNCSTAAQHTAHNTLSSLCNQADETYSWLGWCLCVLKAEQSARCTMLWPGAQKAGEAVPDRGQLDRPAPHMSLGLICVQRCVHIHRGSGVLELGPYYCSLECTMLNLSATGILHSPPALAVKTETPYLVVRKPIAADGHVAGNEDARHVGCQDVRVMRQECVHQPSYTVGPHCHIWQGVEALQHTSSCCQLKVMSLP
jgi:hypothetical protein